MLFIFREQDNIMVTIIVVMAATPVLLSNVNFRIYILGHMFIHEINVIVLKTTYRRPVLASWNANLL